MLVDADGTIDVAGTELPGIEVRAALASFETAAEYGLECIDGPVSPTSWTMSRID